MTMQVLNVRCKLLEDKVEKLEDRLKDLKEMQTQNNESMLNLSGKLARLEYYNHLIGDEDVYEQRR